MVLQQHNGVVQIAVQTLKRDGVLLSRLQVVFLGASGGILCLCGLGDSSSLMTHRDCLLLKRNRLLSMELHLLDEVRSLLTLALLALLVQSANAILKRDCLSIRLARLLGRRSGQPLLLCRSLTCSLKVACGHQNAFSLCSTLGRDRIDDLALILSDHLLVEGDLLLSGQLLPGNRSLLLDFQTTILLNRLREKATLTRRVRVAGEHLGLLTKLLDALDRSPDRLGTKVARERRASDGERLSHLRDQRHCLANASNKTSQAIAQVVSKTLDFRRSEKPIQLLQLALSFGRERLIAASIRDVILEQLHVGLELLNSATPCVAHLFGRTTVSNSHDGKHSIQRGGRFDLTVADELGELLDAHAGALGHHFNGVGDCFSELLTQLFHAHNTLARHLLNGHRRTLERLFLTAELGNGVSQ